MILPPHIKTLKERINRLEQRDIEARVAALEESNQRLWEALLRTSRVLAVATGVSEDELAKEEQRALRKAGLLPP
jgi:hypothetical protein